MKSVGEARPPGFVECGTAEAESELAESLGDEDETGSSWPTANGTTSASPSAKCVDGARPLGIAKCSARTESVLAVSPDEESSDGTGPPWPRASGTWSTAERAAGAKSVVRARPPGIAKFSADGDGTEGSLVGVCGSSWSRKWQQVQNLLLKLGLLEAQRTGL